jgi:hypothetical protein
MSITFPNCANTAASDFLSSADERARARGA